MVSRYSTEDLARFLQRIDDELRQPSRIVLIGGGAVGLAYHGKHATMDLDLWEAGREFWEAVKRVAERDGPTVPVHKAGIAEAPYEFESRLRRLEFNLKRLEVLVPEAHDLVLMKTARAESHDLDAIEDIHREVGLSLEILVERFHETKEQVTGRHESFVIKFQSMVARLFGEDIAEAIEAQLTDASDGSDSS